MWYPCPYLFSWDLNNYLKNKKVEQMGYIDGVKIILVAPSMAYPYFNDDVVLKYVPRKS